VLDVLSEWQNDQIEAVQKRADNIIPAYTHGMLSSSLDSPALQHVVNNCRTSFFSCTVHPRSCLHYLLPPPRDPALLSCSRAPSKFLHTNSRTKKYQSFISYVLSKYQTFRPVNNVCYFVIFWTFSFCLLCVHCVFIFSVIQPLWVSTNIHT